MLNSQKPVAQVNSIFGGISVFVRGGPHATEGGILIKNGDRQSPFDKGGFNHAQ